MNQSWEFELKIIHVFCFFGKLLVNLGFGESLFVCGFVKICPAALIGFKMKLKYRRIVIFFWCIFFPSKTALKTFVTQIGRLSNDYLEQKQTIFDMDTLTFDGLLTRGILSIRKGRLNDIIKKLVFKHKAMAFHKTAFFFFLFLFLMLQS